jgi:hypothetical protein
VDGIRAIVKGLEDARVPEDEVKIAMRGYRDIVTLRGRVLWTPILLRRWVCTTASFVGPLPSSRLLGSSQVVHRLQDAYRRKMGRVDARRLSQLVRVLEMPQIMNIVYPVINAFDNETQNIVVCVLSFSIAIPKV